MLNELLKIYELTTDESKRFMAPRALFNEENLLLLIFNWFFNHKAQHLNIETGKEIASAFILNENSRCYINATLSTPFKTRIKGAKDTLAEPNSLVSGSIGNFKVIYGKEKEKLILLPGTTQFNVFLAMFSPDLKTGIKANKKYNQVARNVGCMMKTLEDAGTEVPSSFGYYLIVPADELKSSHIDEYIQKPNIEAAIKERTRQYREDTEKTEFLTFFNRMIPHLNVKVLAFEDVIRFIQMNDSGYGNGLGDFYHQCLHSRGK